MSAGLVLDLFCCAGGSAKGYHDAGFDVLGVDIKPQPHFPYDFIQSDALEYLEGLMTLSWIDQVDLIHASPPCQAFSALSNSQPGTKEKYPDLIDPVRQLLIKTGKPYVIENVVNAPLNPTVILCGTMFGKKLRLHRLFETNFPVRQPECNHSGYILNPHSSKGRKRMKEEFGYDANLAEVWRKEKGVEWMNWDESSEAILPAYTEYIGREHLGNTCTSYGTRTEVQGDRR